MFHWIIDKKSWHHKSLNYNHKCSNLLMCICFERISQLRQMQFILKWLNTVYNTHFHLQASIYGNKARERKREWKTESDLSHNWWSHDHIQNRTKHLNRWIMGPSPPLQQNHTLHLPLSCSLSPPSPPPHHSFFMFVCVSKRERHTLLHGFSH